MFVRSKCTSKYVISAKKYDVTMHVSFCGLCGMSENKVHKSLIIDLTQMQF